MYYPKDIGCITSVAKVLGHSSTAITRKIYAKTLEETVVREMDKVRL